MGAFKNLTSQKFGRLTVLKQMPNKGKFVMWECKCECGTLKIIHSGTLLNCSTKSCGCWNRERASKSLLTHGMSRTRPYRIWYNMKKRCNDINSSSFKNYGGRKIMYDKKWENFIGFWEDMNIGYSNLLSIDRIDNNGNYCKENCQWSDKLTQSNNTRRNRIFTFNGKTQNITQWENEFGIKPGTVSSRIKRGWTIENALKQKNGKYKLSEKQIRIIKHALSFNVPGTRKWLAKMMDVSIPTIVESAKR